MTHPPSGDNVRLSVLINLETQAAIKQFQARYGCSATEAVRHLIGYGSVIVEAHERGEESVVPGKGNRSLIRNRLTLMLPESVHGAS